MVYLKLAGCCSLPNPKKKHKKNKHCWNWTNILLTDLHGSPVKAHKHTLLSGVKRAQGLHRGNRSHADTQNKHTHTRIHCKATFHFNRNTS